MLLQFPKSLNLYNILGAATTGLRQFDVAINSYKQAINIKPDFAEAYNNMGNAQKEQGHLESAIDSYKQAINIKPDYDDAYNNMGISLRDQGDLEGAIDSYRQAIKLNPDFAKAYNNMGISLRDQGDLEGAINSYKKALKINPSYTEAYSNMGLTMQDQGNFDGAIDSYKQALEINPNISSLKHLLAALTGETTDTAPRDYVEALFDNYADKFETSLIDKLEYEVPNVLAEAVFANKTKSSLVSILDLGCGTGLSGFALKSFCANLEGIDLSNRMLEKAKLKNVYDKLEQADIVEYLIENELDFDYFVSTDVFIYVGELSEIFRLIKSRNKRPGKIAFSTEHTEKEGFFLEVSGRYSHSKKYIEKLCEKFGYRISYFATVNLRKEKEGFVTGGIYILDF